MPGVCRATLVLAVAVEVVAVVAVVALVAAVLVTAVVAAADAAFEVVAAAGGAELAAVLPAATFEGPMVTCGVGPKMLVAPTDRVAVAAGVLVATECSTLLKGLLDAVG